MYRTATIACYDVMDQVMVSAVVMEYPGMPGTAPPRRVVVSAQVTGRGEDDTLVWLSQAAQALLEAAEAL